MSIVDIKTVLGDMALATINMIRDTLTVGNDEGEDCVTYEYSPAVTPGAKFMTKVHVTYTHNDLCNVVVTLLPAETGTTLDGIFTQFHTFRLPFCQLAMMFHPIINYVDEFHQSYEYFTITTTPYATTHPTMITVSYLKISQYDLNKFMYQAAYINTHDKHTAHGMLPQLRTYYCQCAVPACVRVVGLNNSFSESCKECTRPIRHTKKPVRCRYGEECTKRYTTCKFVHS